MVWTKRQLKQHILASRLLVSIMKKAFDFISENKPAEYEVEQFIMHEFKKNRLVTSEKRVMVAYNQSSSSPHYYPKKKSRPLRKNTSVMIDIWARLDERKAPYSDITWMGYYGKIPGKVKRVFDVIEKARDSSLNYVKTQLKKKTMPLGCDVNKAAMDVLIKNGYKKNIMHSTGHSLGTVSPHGTYGGITRRNKHRLRELLGYTIEPGLYFKNKFGVRSEMCFYIKNKVILTTEVQKKIILI